MKVLSSMYIGVCVCYSLLISYIELILTSPICKWVLAAVSHRSCTIGPIRKHVNMALMRPEGRTVDGSEIRRSPVEVGS